MADEQQLRGKRLPRNLWILWYQGEAEAPYVVKKCIESWREKNPTWKVTVLDADSLPKYVEPAFEPAFADRLSMNHLSDLARLRLLATHGGVWADATTFCMRPLDEWIDGYASSGFFAFFQPGRDRVMSSWFLAALPNCSVVTNLADRMTAYFSENQLSNKGPIKKAIVSKLNKRFNKSVATTRLWFSPFVTKILRVHPYFVLHYLFAQLVDSDPQCKAIWEQTPKIGAEGPHRLMREGLLSPLREAIKNEIDSRVVPVYKLTWKYQHDAFLPSSVLYYLTQTTPTWMLPEPRRAVVLQDGDGVE